MTSEWTAVVAPLGLSRAGFFLLSCIFQPAELSPSSFPYTTPVRFVERQFTFHRIVWWNARQEGRGQNNGFHGNKAEKTTQSRCYFCLVLNDHNGWTLAGLSVFEKGYFDWHVPIVHIYVCLFNLFSGKISAGSSQCSWWLFRCRAAAVSVNQSMGPEGRGRERKSWQRKSSRSEKRVGHRHTGQERRQGRNIPSFIVRQCPLLSFFNAKGNTKLCRYDDGYSVFVVSLYSWK